MGATLRALHALVLLAGFYLLGLVILGALAAADVAMLSESHSAGALKLVFLSALLAIPVVRGMFMLRRPEHDGPVGLPVTPAQQPALWAAVRTLADRTGTRVPDALVLTGDVNAAVSEDARLLGLLPGRRTLYLGVPLMTGLTQPQLHAVLAHEMGHYSNADTRLSGITMRGRDSVLRTIELFHQQADKKADKERVRQEKTAARRRARGKKARETDTGGAGLTYRLMAKLYTAYGTVFLRASQAVGRRQELAADRVAARITGRDAMVSALRELPALDAANGFYLDAYATRGVEAGLLPPRGEVFGGLGRMLAARQDELAALREDLPEETASPFDSHPPIAERVRLLEALPADSRASGGVPSALMLLQDSERVLSDLEDAVLLPQVVGMRRADWPEVLHESSRHTARAVAAPLTEAAAAVTGGGGSLHGLLDATDRGQLWQITERLPRSEQAATATGRALREILRPQLRERLAHLVLADLADAGGARWDFSWSQQSGLRLPDGVDDELPAALDAAVADRPDTAPLRKLLPTD